jgi:hypothetical protein
MGFLYIIPIPQKSVFKIGIASNLEDRISNHQANWKNEFGKIDKSKILYTKASSLSKIKHIEQHFKYRFERFLAGINVSGNTEIYNLDCFDEMVNEINKFVESLGVKKLEEYKPNKINPSFDRPKQTLEYRIEKRLLKSKALDDENKNSMECFVQKINSLKGKVKLEYSELSYYLVLNVLDGVNVPKSDFDSKVFPHSLNLLRGHGWFSFIESWGGTDGKLDHVNFNRKNLFEAKLMYPEIWEKLNWEFKNTLDGLDIYKEQMLSKIEKRNEIRRTW